MADTDQGSKLTPLGLFLSFVLIAGLVGLGAYIVLNKQSSANKPPAAGGAKVTPVAGGAEAPQTEAPDTAGVTTVKEYKYIPADKLPPVKGVSQYKWDE